MGPEAMILVFWMLSFKSTFSLSSFTFIKRLFFFAYCCKRFVICISEVIFLSAILIPAHASSSPAFLMMYSAYKLNKQSDNIQLWHTPFLIWNQSVVLFSSKCCFLTFIQISQEAGEVVWYSHLFHNFPQFVVIHTVKVFGIVSKAEVDVFLELYCFFDDPRCVVNLISGSSAFSKSSLNIWKFMVHVLLKPILENLEHYFANMGDECNSVVVWIFFVIAFLKDWNENWLFPVLWPLLSFSNLMAYWVQHFHSIIFKDLKQLSWNSITSTSIVHSDA